MLEMRLAVSEELQATNKESLRKDLQPVVQSL